MSTITPKFLKALLPLVVATGLWSPLANSSENVERLAASPIKQDGHVPIGLLQIPAQSEYYSSYAFVVDKQERKLSVWKQTGNGLREVANFPADLGKKNGPKQLRGDHKTPEGIYFLLDQLDGANLDFSQYGKRAFTTDYPNLFDKLDGRTGDGIWLHAVPDDVPLTRGSRGCVVVRNDVILDLTQYVRLKRTPILIQDSTKRVPAAEAEKKTAEMNQWLEAWRVAWESKNIDSYISFYGPDFKSMNMNRDQWRTFKDRLNRNYDAISVKISKPAIFVDRDRVIVRFLQEYTSDQHTDFGEKVLYVKKDDKGYRIVGENWMRETSQIAREEIRATTHSTTTLSKTCTGAEADCS